VERVSQLPAAERVARLAEEEEEEERVAPQAAAEPVSPQLAQAAPALRPVVVLQALAAQQAVLEWALAEQAV